MTKRDEGTEPGAQHCPNLTPQLSVFSVGYQLKMTEKQKTKWNDVAYEISTVSYQEKLVQACSLEATGKTGRNRAQMHCTTASGTLTSEQK